MIGNGNLRQSPYERDNASEYFDLTSRGIRTSTIIVTVYFVRDTCQSVCVSHECNSISGNHGE